MESVHRSGAAAVHEFLVVVQIEAVEVDALAAVDLLDAQDLSRQKLDGFPRAGRHHEFRDHRACGHRDGSALVSAFRAAAYSRSASRTSAAVSETVAVQKTMELMINLDGVTLLFPTSFGYFNPFMVDAAKKFPKVEFRHPTTLWQADKHASNLGGYFCYLDQAHYVNGIAAGLSTRSNKIGFIAAKPIPLVLRNVNSFTLGARKVNPNVTVQLIITGDWALPVREAEAANALVDAGSDIIAGHVDSPKVVIETAEKRGVKSCGPGRLSLRRRPLAYQWLFQAFESLFDLSPPIG